MLRRLRDGIEWFAVGTSLVVQAGVVAALAYLELPDDPGARLRVLVEYGFVAVAFLVTAVGAFYLAARRVKQARPGPAAETS